MNVAYTLERKDSISIDRLRDLVGHDVLLLHWPWGLKGTKKKWGHLTTEDMKDESYLAKLATGNVGVALGAKSNGLCVVDCDEDGWDEKFLALNPVFAATLRTRGRRGSSFWVRIVGEFPASTTLTCGLRELGEWRANGNQSIIAGLHPVTGKLYQILNHVKPIEIAFSEIKWPDGVSFVKKPIKSKRSPRNETPELVKNVTHVSQVSQDLQVSQESHVVFVSSVCDLEGLSEAEVVRLCLPVRPEENHARLFMLARGVKSLERKRGAFCEKDLRRVFGKWYRQAYRFLKVNQSRAAYYEEFLNACDTALVALDEGGLMTAWQRAKKYPQPECATVLKSQAGRMLVSLCWQLQCLAGESEFFLSCYSAGKLLKVTATHAARLLRTLCAKGVLLLIEKGDSGKGASRYQFSKSVPRGITL